MSQLSRLNIVFAVRLPAYFTRSCILTAAVVLIGCVEEQEPRNTEVKHSEQSAGTCTPVQAASNAKFPEAWPSTFAIGRDALAAEIRAWDVDVRPDGDGLPEGHGTAEIGAEIYMNKCAACHGVNGTGGVADRLVGLELRAEFPFGQSSAYQQQKSIGNYWPYATTLFDYTNRTMPQNAPGSLSVGEVYSLTAYLLHMNDIISIDHVLNQDNLASVEMPARDRFVPDSRCGGPDNW